MALDSEWVVDVALPREVTAEVGKEPRDLGSGCRHWLHQGLSPPPPTSARSWQRWSRGACANRHGAGGQGAHLQVKTSVRSLQVLHLTKQHQWNLQLHCQTLVY